MGRLEMRQKEVDLGRIIREIITDLEPGTAGRKIHWQIGDLPTVSGDPSMLRIALMNLLSNAVKFTRLKETTVIETGCEYREGDVAVFVRDNGVGYDQEFAGKLFGVFQRLHREDEFEGTGVSLAMVQRIIHRHGGGVRATGVRDHGATLYFSLPFYNEGGV